MRRLFIMLTLVLSLLACSHNSSYAQGGAVLVRIPVSDTAKSHCINPASDKVWLTLRRIILDKSRGFLREDNAVAIILKASVAVDPPTQDRISFPLMAKATLDGYSVGQVSVPLEYGLVRGLALLQEETIYSGIDLELTVLNLQDRTGWGRALEALAETADKIPLPASPVKDAATYLLDLANSAIDKDLADQDEDDKLKSATLALNFDPSGQCVGGMDSDFESTGTLAVLMESGDRDSEDGIYVPVNQTNDYCWRSEKRPAFVLKAVRKQSGTSCDDQVHLDSMRQVSNNYYAFFLNALKQTGELSTVDSDEVANALRRCAANGVSEADCL